MKRLRRQIRLVALGMTFLLFTLIGFGAYSVLVQGNRWFSSSANTYLRDMKSSAIPGNIMDRNGVVLASTDQEGKRVYNADESVRRAVVHIVGDRKNNVGYGAESFMSNYLYGFNISYFQRLAHALRGEKLRGNNITLSIDSNLSRYIASVFPKDKKGAVVVMNYRTGEVVSLQSFPNFDPDQVTEKVKTDPTRPFWNNATRWLSAPGSTFKTVTLAAALRNVKDAETREFVCSGELPFTGSVMHDAAKAKHGTLSLQKAFSVSCNITFANLALEMGDEALKKTARGFGVDDYFLFQDFVVENSIYPDTNRTTKEVAWTGVGQSALQVTPMHMCMVASAVANDGVMMEPKLLLKAVTINNELKAQFAPKVYQTPLKQEEAALIKGYMQKAVASGTGRQAAVAGKRVCGKTGTAEVDGQKEPNAWFIGFLDEPRYPYAICVVVMDAGGGGSVAAPLAGQIFSAMTGTIR